MERAILTTSDVLHADIIANPDDDTPRLVLADWLEENGEETRATFIRVQIQLARIDPRPWHEECDDASACPCYRLHHQERELWDANQETDWMESYVGVFEWGSGHDYIPQDKHAKLNANGRIWRRGFVDTVRMGQVEWLKIGAKVVRRHPIRDVRLTDKYPAFHDSDKYAWWNNTDAWSGGLALINPALFAIMLEQLEHSGGSAHQANGAVATAVVYQTKQAAFDALSAACLTYARDPKRTAQPRTVLG